MLHLNRKTEYALLALQHIHVKEAKMPDEVTSTREVAKTYHIPYTVLAKVMQQLAGRGLIKSVHGTKGGYVLAKRPNTVSVADVIQVFEGAVAVADCFKAEKITCPQWGGCTIRDPFFELNRKLHVLLSETTVANLTAGIPSAPDLVTHDGEGEKKGAKP